MAAVCFNRRTLKVPYHNKADGFMAALVLALNQVKFCEIHYCRPSIEWGPFPSCKYAGVRYPGRTPFFEKARGPNAFEYYFRPLCENPPSQLAAPKLTCEQREQVHRVLPWAVRTYYYGRNDPQSSSPTNGSWAEFNEQWYRKQRTEGARLVSKYLRLQPSIEARLEQLSVSLLGRAGGPSRKPNGVTLPHSPTLGVHLRGTDKGKYIQTAGSGRQVLPLEYIPYVHAFLEAHPNGSVFVATDSPSFLSEVQERWPQSRVRYQREVLRMETNIAFSAGKHSNYRKGEEVLLDMLLLSRCDFLLHAASGVAEFAIYFNPKLHHIHAGTPRTFMGANHQAASREQTPQTKEEEAQEAVDGRVMLAPELVGPVERITLSFDVLAYNTLPSQVYSLILALPRLMYVYGVMPNDAHALALSIILSALQPASEP